MVPPFAQAFLRRSVMPTVDVDYFLGDYPVRPISQSVSLVAAGVFLTKPPHNSSATRKGLIISCEIRS